jgi:hypothetical protein
MAGTGGVTKCFGGEAKLSGTMRWPRKLAYGAARPRLKSKTKNYFRDRAETAEKLSANSDQQALSTLAYALRCVLIAHSLRCELSFPASLRPCDRKKFSLRIFTIMRGSAECFRSTRFCPFSAYLPFNKRMILESANCYKPRLKTKDLLGRFAGRFWNGSGRR